MIEILNWAQSKNKPACVMGGDWASNSALTLNVWFSLWTQLLSSSILSFNFYLLSGGEVHSALWKNINIKNKNKTNGLRKLGFYTVDGF